MSYNKIFPEKEGYIFPHHFEQCGYCQKGSRRHMLNSGLTKDEVRDFYKNGMIVEEFIQKFGNDHQAMKIVEHVKNGK